MYSRPKPTETDEDLLRQHREFAKVKNQIKLAATVISEKDQEEEDDNNENTRTNTQETTAVDIQEQLANTFEAVPQTQNVGRIIEKNLEGKPKVTQIRFTTNQGFPQAKRRDSSIANRSGGSIFAQQMKKLKKTSQEPMEVDDDTELTTAMSSHQKSISKKGKAGLPQHSIILTGPEKNQIHEENMQKIQSLSEQEIMEERERLMATMDPALIAYLKSRRKKEEAKSFRNPTIQEQNEAAQDVDVDQLETPNEVLNQPNADRWLNFGTVEANKLGWMQNMNVPKLDKSQAFEARFDFEGWLMPYSENEITEKSRILYHHGEEAGRPGYTLQELFQLARSNITQQKIIALNTIANILSLDSTGVYDGTLELPIEQIFFVLRFCLDDNTPGVLNAAIKAIRNLFYNKVDETCLDCLLGFGLSRVQPVLAVDHETEDDETVNDQQLAEKNLVKCLIRTEILTRIRYIINTVKPSTETIVYCMDILARLARDSEFILTKVYKCDGLIESIVKNFVPTSAIIPNSASPYGLPLLQALKLLRVLACRSKHVASELCKKYNVIGSLLLYLSSENYAANADGLRLQTECLHLWNVFIHYDLGLDAFQVFYPILMQMLNYHFQNTDMHMKTTYVRQGHASGLLSLIGHVADKHLQLVSACLGLLQECCSKWITQFMKLKEFSCGKLQIISSVFFCISNVWKNKHIIAMNTRTAFEKLILDLVKSEAFGIVTETIKNGSMLLNNYKTYKSSPNLKTLETAAWYASEHVIPLIQTNSPLPFLTSLSNFVRITDNCDLKLAFLKHANIQNYITALRESNHLYLTSHWFTRVESELVLNILKTSVSLRKDLDTSSFYELAVKCLSIFTTDQKPDIEFLLVNIMFSSQFYPSDVLMQSLDINQRSDSLELSLSHLDEILTVYTQVLGLRVNVINFDSNLCMDAGMGNVIPLDWIYTPIIVLYSNQQENKQTIDENDQIFTIRNCLRWVLIYETYFPELAASINPTDRYCRIACVFLGSDNLFLNPEIHNLLESCFKNVISKHEKDIDFNKEIHGLNSFQDFYTQLLEQYQGVSYGDVLFGNFVLVPLAQRHNVKWRKTLWSEYMGVAEMCNVTPEQTVCSLESFLSPAEEDVSLLKCYRRAIVNNLVRKHSVLFKIAKHHVEQYVARIKNKTET